MRHTLPLSPQFYVTAPQPCPYLRGQVERKLFTALQGDDAERLNTVLSHQGFRRSQNVLYRPCCAQCNACLSARIVVDSFSPGRSQRRIARRNADLSRRIGPAHASDAQFRLFRRYLDQRHADGGMADMDMHEFTAMIEETPVSSRIVEYRAPATAEVPSGLIAVCLTDILADGLSMVYSFFEPQAERRSLGTQVILDHVAMAREMGLPYVYLGYWVPGSPKMDYKARFRPLEVYRNGAWREMGSIDISDLRSGAPRDRQAINDQVAAIHLPGAK